MIRLRAAAHTLTTATLASTTWAITAPSLWQTITAALAAWVCASFAAGAYYAAHNLQQPRRKEPSQ